MSKINFLPPWVETNEQPAFYDLESGTCLQQTARMYNKVNELVRTANTQNEIIADYVEQFNELHDFVYDYFDNLDVQAEVDHKLDEMAEDGTLQTLVFAYIEPQVVLNIKHYGAVGDGVTDDYEAIQTAINENPLKTLRFDEGTYLISEHLSLPATDTEKVFLELDPNATLKAADSFTDSFMVIVGETGDADGYGNSKHQTGISGGVLDCNSVTGGIKSERTHLATFKDINIINCKTTGIQINKSNNDSSDAYLSNINIVGIDGNDLDTLGVNIIGYDNNIEMVRTTGCHIGFNLDGAGNYLYNCHPLYASKLAETNYNTSIGFNIVRSDNNLTDCYADNFSVGVKCTGSSWRANNLFCYWYDTGVSNEHTAILTTSANFLGQIDGLTIGFPSQGINKGLVVADEEHPSVYYPYSYHTLNGDADSGSIKNLYLPNSQWNKMTNKYVDPLLCSDLRCHNNFCIRGLDDDVIANKYYPIMIIPNLGSAGTLSSQHYEATFSIGQEFSVDLGFRIYNDNLSMDRVDTTYNPKGYGFSFGLAKPTGMNNAYILYIKMDTNITSGNRMFSTTINNRMSGLRMTLIPRNAIYSNAELNGIDSLDNSLGTTHTFANQNYNAGVFNNETKWQAVHTIYLKETLPTGDTNKRPVFMFCRWGSSTAIYAYYNGFTTVIDETHKSGSDSVTFSYDDSTGALTVTYDKTGIINYVKF